MHRCSTSKVVDLWRLWLSCFSKTSASSETKKKVLVFDCMTFPRGFWVRGSDPCGLYVCGTGNSLLKCLYNCSGYMQFAVLVVWLYQRKKRKQQMKLILYSLWHGVCQESHKLITTLNKCSQLYFFFLLGIFVAETINAVYMSVLPQIYNVKRDRSVCDLCWLNKTDLSHVPTDTVHWFLHTYASVRPCWFGLFFTLAVEVGFCVFLRYTSKDHCKMLFLFMLSKSSLLIKHFSTP